MNDQLRETTRVIEALTDIDDVEIREWIESLEYVLQTEGPERVSELFERLHIYAHAAGVQLPYSANTPYINTIPASAQPPFPGSREIERRIKSIIRWNAMAMVVRANRIDGSIGGHISTYASSATLYEVAFNHFFRAPHGDHPGDLIYFQGHASPGIYARAFLEGRLSEEQLNNFRRELKPQGGLSSYPHPWLMPDFWNFPTVSMGLGPIMSIYHARFIRYLEDRGLKTKTDQKVWAFLGDGETDEPESLGSISLAAREKLDNLIWVINCNLQRLDGPVRGNGKIIQELEANFRGNGWNVIKVIWGGDWDPILDKDIDGRLVKRMGEIVDGWFQKFSVESGAYIRKHLANDDEKIADMFAHLSDDQLRRMRRGGHDPEKVYAAYQAATENKSGRPTVILAQTIKGYGLGEAGEGKNITHQQKKLNNDELRDFRTRFGIPISDEQVAEAPFYKPPADSPEMKYLHERRKSLGGYLPQRKVTAQPLPMPSESIIDEFFEGTPGREVSTTMAFVRMLANLLRDKDLGRLIVPIVPDEARTFGMEALFRQVGIYSHAGQLYEPVDAKSLLYYKEAKDGQILEEGITEAGSLSSFVAAGTAYANHGINTIPFFIFYSMFGFQRVGDLIWAGADSRTKGFLVGATSGRTTLNGEGLQHEDGQSHIYAMAVPNIRAYDPAFAYELGMIVLDGIKRMYVDQEDIFYYISVMNENYEQPAVPAHLDREALREGVLKGMYRFRPATSDSKLTVNLFGSGTILNEVLAAQKILGEKYGVAADVWSVTSYNELHREGHECERHNMLHPLAEPQTPWVAKCFSHLAGRDNVFVAASDYIKALPDSIARWLPGNLVTLGTDGFGRSESRQALREFFEVDHRFIAIAALTGLMRMGKITPEVVKQAMSDFGIAADKPNPLTH